MLFDEIDYRDGVMPWAEPPRRPSRFGTWTWIFFGIVGLGLLIGLILPGLLPPRCRFSRKLQCASNLRQMGLGISAYANTYNQFPPGTIRNPDLPLDRRLGWGVTILPYIDQVEYLRDHGTTLEAALHLPSDDAIFDDLQKLGIVRCPESIIYANFVAIAGLGLDAPSLPTKDPRAGIFGDDRRVTPADIKDGAANTMMLVESSIVSVR